MGDLNPQPSATLTNSRVDGNTATDNGGGLSVYGDAALMQSRVDHMDSPCTPTPVAPPDACSANCLYLPLIVR
jgi:hypothetical protein